MLVARACVCFFLLLIILRLVNLIISVFFLCYCFSSSVSFLKIKWKKYYLLFTCVQIQWRDSMTTSRRIAFCKMFDSLWYGISKATTFTGYTGLSLLFFFHIRRQSDSHTFGMKLDISNENMIHSSLHTCVSCFPLKWFQR